MSKHADSVFIYDIQNCPTNELKNEKFNIFRKAATCLLFRNLLAIIAMGYI